jgi:hypothetical protein
LGILYYSYEVWWSHGISPILVTSLPFLLGPRHHDGFDGWLRRRAGRLWNDVDDRRARAALLGTQLLLSLVFLNAAYYKYLAYGQGGGFSLPWVFSDNMRNVIIRQHVLFDVPLEEPFRFIVKHAFAYQGLALANMLAQSIPFVACFLMAWPRLRLVCGLLLAAEVLGLGIVMGIWNLHWFLFPLFFLDWDRLIFRRHAGADSTHCDVRSHRWPMLVQGALMALIITFNSYVMIYHDR